jgi:hypothetical protein
MSQNEFARTRDGKVSWSLALSIFCTIFVAASSAPALDSPYTPGPGRYPRFEAKQAEPGLTLGESKDLPLPKTILYSVGVDELLADAEEWSRRGFNAFFLTGISGDWSTDIWGADGEPWTLGHSDKNFQKVQQAAQLCRSLDCEIYLTMAFGRLFDWFDDTAWSRIEDNFRQFAIFARDSGCAGIAIDIEYIHAQYHYNWEGYDYSKITRRDIPTMIRKRMTRVAQVMYDAFPEAPLLTFPEGGFGLGSIVHAAWLEEAARRNAPGGIHICAEYSYRRPNPRYLFGHAWLNHRFMHEILSERGQRYLREKCSFAEGLWPFGIDPEDYHGAAPSLEEFGQAYAATLMVGRRYNWIYSHDARPAMLGRESEKYSPKDLEPFMKVIAEKNIITNPAYIKTAHDLREMILRDYSEDLGLSVVVSFSGPREEGEIGLMPNSIIGPSPLAQMQKALWGLGLKVLRGGEVDFQKEWGFQTHWMMAGPFPNVDGQGFGTAYPPEEEVDLAAEYDGLSGKVRWMEASAPAGRASMDLAGIFQPTEQVCTYALCYVHSGKEREAQLRVGSNDMCKIWLGGQLVFESPSEGRIMLDKDIIPVKLAAGVTPVLIKVCNNRKDWGFIFRLTDAGGKPLRGVEYRLTP